MQIRQAKPSDKKIVLDFCKDTFAWGDYISHVWDYWILEGNLLVIIEDDVAVAVSHAAFFEEYSIVWIEGIRVNPSFRRLGLAKKLVDNFELTAKKNNCHVSKMLIESNNSNSLNLARSLNYTIESKWIFFTLTPKKNSLQSEIKFVNNENKIPSALYSKLMYYVKSWRWLPLTTSNIQKLASAKSIVYSKNSGVVSSFAILTVSEHFDKTLMVTFFGTGEDFEKIISHIQNFSIKMNFERIQILTINDSLPHIGDLEKKYSFNLLSKKI